MNNKEHEERQTALLGAACHIGNEISDRIYTVHANGFRYNGNDVSYDYVMQFNGPNGTRKHFSIVVSD